MLAGRAGADTQLEGNLLVRPSGCHEIEDGQLTEGQAIGIASAHGVLYSALQLFPRRLRRLLRPLALRDVPHDTYPDLAALVGDGFAADLHREGRSILAEPPHLVGFPISCENLLPHQIMTVGRKEAPDVRPKKLRKLISKHRRCPRVGVQDSLAVVDDDSLEGGFRQSAEAVLALPQCLVRPTPSDGASDSGGDSLERGPGGRWDVVKTM